MPCFGCVGSGVVRPRALRSVLGPGDEWGWITTGIAECEYIQQTEARRRIDAEAAAGASETTRGGRPRAALASTRGWAGRELRADGGSRHERTRRKGRGHQRTTRQPPDAARTLTPSLRRRRHHRRPTQPTSSTSTSPFRAQPTPIEPCDNYYINISAEPRERTWQ